MTNENQHWVPQFLIRQFVDSDGRVFRFDVQTEKITKPPPKYAAAESDFNEYEIEGDLISFEQRLTKIETQAAPILKRIVSERSTAALTKVERVKIAEFVAVQSFRTKAFYKGMSMISSKSEFGVHLTTMWRSMFITAGKIANRHWALMVIDSDDVFYLGDNPVVLQNTQNPTNGGELGFDVKGVEAYLPITPKYALYMPCRATGDLIIKTFEDAFAIHKFLRTAILGGAPGGQDELALTQRVMANSGALHSAFTKGTPIIAVTQNVENLNYLQCSWSHDAIFSNRNDFSFAKMVFEKSPQYRGVPKTSLVEFKP